MRLPYLGKEDNVEIRKTDGYSTLGKYLAINESFVVVEGTVGSTIGKIIFIPMSTVSEIIKL